MEETKSKVIDSRALFKNDKAVKFIMIGGLALILLIFLSSLFESGSGGSSNSRGSPAGELSYAEHEKRLEEKLIKAISAIDGVGGELTVVVTLDSLSETVYSERGSAVRTVITPRVRGVAVICSGGENVIVKGRIIEVVSRVLGVSTARISVTN